MANNMMTLLTTAAELRSGGATWEMIGSKLNRSPNTCRQWPNRYPQEWQSLFSQAEEERWKEAGYQAVSILRQLLHNENPRIQIQSASQLIKWNLFHKKLQVQQGIDPNRTYYDVNHFIPEEPDESPPFQATNTPPPYSSVPSTSTNLSALFGTAAACLLFLICFHWLGLSAQADTITPNMAIATISDQTCEKPAGNHGTYTDEKLVPCGSSNVLASAHTNETFPWVYSQNLGQTIPWTAANETAFDAGSSNEISRARLVHFCKKVSYLTNVIHIEQVE